MSQGLDSMQNVKQSNCMSCISNPSLEMSKIILRFIVASKQSDVMQISKRKETEKTGKKSASNVERHELIQSILKYLKLKSTINSTFKQMKQI